MAVCKDGSDGDEYLDIVPVAFVYISSEVVERGCMAVGGGRDNTHTNTGVFRNRLGAVGVPVCPGFFAAGVDVADGEDEGKIPGGTTGRI